MAQFLKAGPRIKSHFSNAAIIRSITTGLLKPIYKNEFYSSRLQLIHMNGAQKNTIKDISPLIFSKNRRSVTSKENSRRPSTNFLNSNISTWTRKLLPLLREKVKRCNNMRILKQVPMEKVIMITILELLQLHKDYCAIGSVNLSHARNEVGNAIENIYLAHKTTQEKNSRLWTRRAKEKIGGTLISLVLDVAKIPVPSYDPDTYKNIVENIPVFYLTFKFNKGNHTEIIKFSDDLTKIISCEDLFDILRPESLPMLMAAPNSSLSQSWFLNGSDDHPYVKSDCVYSNDAAEQITHLSDISGISLLKKASKGLDILGSIPWSVNKNILEVIHEVWNKGEAIAGIPLPIKEVPILSPNHRKYKTGEYRESTRMTTVKKRACDEKYNHSRRCDVNYKVGIASKFSNSTIYFPHDIDKEGLIYSKSNILNFQNGDLCRGLLHFNDAKPLGASGWSQLKVHLANSNGYINYSFAEKEKYTIDNMENILDSADNPLTGKRWWLNNDSPWQCLAACYEIAAAYRSGNPEKFDSRLPIHQYNTYSDIQQYDTFSGNLKIAQDILINPVGKHYDQSNTATEQGDVFFSRLSQFLKASHSLISVVDSHEKGMTCVPGHNGYWTHACDIDAISKATNDYFVQFYSHLIMKNFIEEVQKRHERSVLDETMMLLNSRVFSNIKKGETFRGM